MKTPLKCVMHARDHAGEQPRFIFINAWNEWIEGSYLLPDKVNGFGYLKAVRSVFAPYDMSE